MKKIFAFNMAVFFLVAMPPQAQAAVPNISDDVWHTIENSDAYRSFPKSRASKVSFKARSIMKGTGTFKGKRESDVSFSMKSTPVGDRCLKIQTNDGVPNSYQCLGRLLMSMGEIIKLTKVEIKGSLFPMKIGAEMLIRSKSESKAASNKTKGANSMACKVSSQGKAHDLHPKLTGVAWKINCDSQWSNDSPNMKGTQGSTDYYLEDVGVFLSQIGVIDILSANEKGGVVSRFVLPSAGSKSKVIAKGEYGSVTTKTYASYDWSVDK